MSWLFIKDKIDMFYLLTVLPKIEMIGNEMLCRSIIYFILKIRKFKKKKNY